MFRAPLPDGSGSTQLYFDIDKSRQQILTEILTKKAHRQIKTHFPNDNIGFRRSDGTVTFDFVPMLQVVAPSPNVFELKWNLKLLAETGMNKPEIHDSLMTALASPDQNITWG